MLAELLRSLLCSLTLTLALELGGALLLGVRARKDLLLILLVNVLTNPPLVLTLDLVYLTWGMPPWYLIAALELSAVSVEALLFRRRLLYSHIPPLLLSFFLNALSYFGGLLL